jgi:hypothetical protein
VRTICFDPGVNSLAAAKGVNKTTGSQYLPSLSYPMPSSLRPGCLQPPPGRCLTSMAIHRCEARCQACLKDWIALTKSPLAILASPS